MLSLHRKSELRLMRLTVRGTRVLSMVLQSTETLEGTCIVRFVQDMLWTVSWTMALEASTVTASYSFVSMSGSSFVDQGG